MVNTCAVTAESERKSAQLLRRAGGQAAHVIAVGCFAQLRRRPPPAPAWAMWAAARASPTRSRPRWRSVGARRLPRRCRPAAGATSRCRSSRAPAVNRANAARF
ncbi:MAG: hypothetical protein ACLUFV_05455 [Acutalibacteraceae bacterium]